eukprot:1137971-Pelagomonas_calceolata.AAC.4
MTDTGKCSRLRGVFPTNFTTPGDFRGLAVHELLTVLGLYFNGHGASYPYWQYKEIFDKNKFNQTSNPDFGRTTPTTFGTSLSQLIPSVSVRGNNCLNNKFLL